MEFCFAHNIFHMSKSNYYFRTERLWASFEPYPKPLKMLFFVGKKFPQFFVIIKLYCKFQSARCHAVSICIRGIRLNANNVLQEERTINIHRSLSPCKVLGIDCERVINSHFLHSAR